MRYYAYFPGCSMESTGAPIEKSIHSIAKPLDMELMELEDWNCCGSSPVNALDKLKAIGMSARVLAIAEKTGLDLVTPCSSCYTVLRETNDILKEDHETAEKVQSALAKVGMKYNNTVKVRHMISVLYEDIGLENLTKKVVKPLTGLKVACYHGCQQVRPRYGLDDTELPDWIDKIAVALGAEPVNYPLKARCCGSSLNISESDVAQGLIYKLLQNARDNGAECIVSTTCPLCHVALDAYQSMALSKFNCNFRLPVIAVTQLIAVALGLDYEAAGLDGNIVSPNELLEKCGKPAAAPASADTTA